MIKKVWEFLKELFGLIKEFWELTKDDKKDMVIAAFAVMFYLIILFYLLGVVPHW